jgi:DNA modification methylase
MTVTLLRGDALHLPLADHTVDLVITSPPYFGLRSYQDGGQHYAGQIGSEATPAEWVEAMLAATAEMVRVLKPCGSIWVNLGDRYSTGNSGQSRLAELGLKYRGGGHTDAKSKQRNAPAAGFRPKTLLGLPWRFALACIDQLGLILRAEVIWSKPNGLPESVTDRVRRSHETWLHFTVQPRYFSAVDEIREPHTGGSHAPGSGASRRWLASSTNGQNHRAVDTDPSEYNSLGKLPGSVWSIPSQPLTVPTELGVDHFAAFPMAWPRRLIGGWSPAGICTVCGEGRRPVVDKRLKLDHMQSRVRGFGEGVGRGALGNMGSGEGKVNGYHETTVTGYVCGCPDTTAPTTPAVVADVFGGTGTTALVAHVMGRHGITIDLSADYCRLAAWRTTDPAQLAQAAQVDKPPVQTVGQDTLFEVTG